MEMDSKIIQKYDIPGPRYTSYPPANLFKEGFTGDRYISALKQSNHAEPEGISFYVHVPFCPRLCHFCGCNTQIGNDAGLIHRYFDALLREINRVSEYLDSNRTVIQVHFGGGTPNSVDLHHIEKVMIEFRKKFRFSDEAEIAIECSPAYLDYSDIGFMAELGINRFSLGVQDFNESVLRVINREPSKQPLEKIVDHIQTKTAAKVNLDFVYGLPVQTLESYLATLQKAADIRPDRMVTFSYAHVPWVKSAQKILEKTGIPGADLKLQMLLSGYELLVNAGYSPIGMDHFALPDDEMAKAYNDRTLHRNFQGYCTKKHTGQVYAFGTSAITQLSNGYIQNTKSVKKYIAELEKGELPVEKGYLLDEKEQIVREIINQVMCNGYLDLTAEAGKWQMEVGELKELLAYSTNNFRELEDDGLLSIEQDRISASKLGKFLIRLIAMQLDPEYASYQTSFSKTI